MSAPLRNNSHKRSAMEVEPEILSERNASSADSLVSTNVPDDMANEQTWPTEEEMSSAVTHSEATIDAVPDASKGTTPKRIKRIPRGMSEYQASWIVDESDEESEDNASDQKSAIGEQDEEMVPLASAEDIDNDRTSAVAFQDLDVEEEERQCVSWHISLL